jgi:hypothetical protein
VEKKKMHKKKMKNNFGIAIAAISKMCQVLC